MISSDTARVVVLRVVQTQRVDSCLHGIRVIRLTVSRSAEILDTQHGWRWCCSSMGLSQRIASMMVIRLQSCLSSCSVVLPDLGLHALDSTCHSPPLLLHHCWVLCEVAPPITAVLWRW